MEARARGAKEVPYDDAGTPTVENEEVEDQTDCHCAAVQTPDDDAEQARGGGDVAQGYQCDEADRSCPLGHGRVHVRQQRQVSNARRDNRPCGQSVEGLTALGELYVDAVGRANDARDETRITLVVEKAGAVCNDVRPGQCVHDGRWAVHPGGGVSAMGAMMEDVYECRMGTRRAV